MIMFYYDLLYSSFNAGLLIALFLCLVYVNKRLTGDVLA